MRLVTTEFKVNINLHADLRRNIMKRFPIAILLLMMFLSTLIFSFPAYAESEKVILHIEGMV